jgi:hypothetical protein
MCPTPFTDWQLVLIVVDGGFWFKWIYVGPEYGVIRFL